MSTNSAFQTSVDIANRAMQHVGARRIASMSEDSKAADEVNFSYHKIRQAELRRNVWRFATRLAALRPVDTDTMVIVPPAYSAALTYITGSIVTYGDVWWQAVEDLAAAQTPGTVAGWGRYFGPQTATAYDVNTSYYSGELVYTPATGSYRVYLSLKNGNDEDPRTPADWDATVTYQKRDVVTYSSSEWQSTQELNLNNTPGGGGWEAIPGTQYGGMSGQHWLDLGGKGGVEPNPEVYGVTLKSLVLPYPLGTGPSSDNNTKNVYRLPYGFLREAPQDPKAGSSSYLGAPSGLSYNDWTFGGDYFTSVDGDLIVFRFVADIEAVPEMDQMFCEGFACRLAMELAEPLTQSTEKLTVIGQVYTKFMSEARIVNGIETGSTEPPEDDYITCRR